MRGPVRGLFALAFFGLAAPALGQMHRDIDRIGARDVNCGEFGFPNRFTRAQERELGRARDRQLLGQLEASRHAGVAAYLAELAADIGRRSDYTGALEVRLTRASPYHAFATMGGYLYVGEAVVARVEDEAELAGVVAHEIGHLAARHGAENLTRSELVEVNPGAIRLLLAASLSIRSLLPQGAAVGFWTAVSHRNELEADELATQYLWNAGFDPEGLLSFLARVEDGNWLDQSPGVASSATHPPIRLRRKRLREVLRSLPALGAARITSSRFLDAKDALRPPFRTLPHR